MSRDSSVAEADDFFAGDDRVLDFTIFDSDDPATAAPKDITGYSLEWALKRFVTDTTALITKTTGGGGIALTDPTNGVLSVTLLDTDTESLAENNYVYALRRTDDGLERMLAVGGFYIRQGALTGA